MLTLRTLIQNRMAIDVELGRRGISRTSGPIVGELGEKLAHEIYGGDLATPGQAAVDLVAADGQLVQVKARALPAGDQRFFSFKSFDFDIALCIRFDRATYDVEWAREFTAAEVESLSSAQRSDWRLRTGVAATSGRDRTSDVRTAFQRLDEPSSR